jgi:hypothetical protein
VRRNELLMAVVLAAWKAYQEMGYGPWWFSAEEALADIRSAAFRDPHSIEGWWYGQATRADFQAFQREWRRRCAPALDPEKRKGTLYELLGRVSESYSVGHGEFELLIQRGQDVPFVVYSMRLQSWQSAQSQKLVIKLVTPRKAADPSWLCVGMRVSLPRS